MKIWFQELDAPGNLSDEYYEAIQKEFRLATKSDTEVVIKRPSKGWLGTEKAGKPHIPLAFSYFRFLNEREVMEGMMQAEKEGYDAVVVDSCYDDCLWTAKATLNIPVTGLLESSMVISQLLGARFAIVTNPPGTSIPLLEHRIRQYGFSGKTIGTRPVRELRLSTESYFKGFQEPGPVVESFEHVAKTCIDDGAEVILEGESLLAPLLTLNGVRDVSGVPVVDCVIAALKIAELLVDLKKAGLSWVSRRGLYCSPTKEDIETVRGFYPYLGSLSE